MDTNNPQNTGAQDPNAPTPPQPVPPAGTPPAGTPPPPPGGTPPANVPVPGMPPAGTPPPVTPPPGTPAPGQPPAGTPPLPGGTLTTPPSGTPVPGTPPPPPPKDDTPANFQLGTLFKEGVKITLSGHPDSTFDDNYFLKLLSASISLSRAEKKRIVDAIPKLKQWQIDELINIFEEEKKKFAQLSKRHVPQLEKLAKQHYEEWRDIEMSQEQTGKVEEDQAKADEIRKSLGL